MSGLNPSEGRLGHLCQYSTCRLVCAGNCTQYKSSATITTTARALLLHVCTTVHACCLQTTARTTRVLLYTYATQRPIGTRARSLHVGTPAHVYTLPTAGSPTYARVGRYATVPARAGYRWAHPPTCTPYTAVRFLTSARAPVVILQR